MYYIDKIASYDDVVIMGWGNLGKRIYKELCLKYPFKNFVVCDNLIGQQGKAIILGGAGSFC